MRHSINARASTFALGLCVGLAALGVAPSVQASSKFPPVLKAALEAQFPGTSFCVPQCTACHLTTQGGPGMMNVFGQNLEKYASLVPVDGISVTKAIPIYFTLTVPADAPQTADTHEFDSDGDGVSDRAELLAGDSPSVSLPRGQSQFCPDIKYGCAGGRIAAAPPAHDGIGLLEAALLALGLVVARRFRRATRKAEL